jgi:hypothetical protein
VGVADRARVDLEHGNVGVRVGADDLCVDGRAVVADADLDAAGARDDVLVGDDVPVGVEEEARAAGDALVRGRLDVDDAVGDAAVELGEGVVPMDELGEDVGTTGAEAESADDLPEGRWTTPATTMTAMTAKVRTAPSTTAPKVRLADRGFMPFRGPPPP